MEQDHSQLPSWARNLLNSDAAKCNPQYAEDIIKEVIEKFKQDDD